MSLVLGAAPINCQPPCLEKNGVSAEKLELVHCVGVERDNGVVIVYCLVYVQPIGRLLSLLLEQEAGSC
jgi:hypothetical protein